MSALRDFIGCLVDNQDCADQAHAHVNGSFDGYLSQSEYEGVRRSSAEDMSAHMGAALAQGRLADYVEGFKEGLDQRADEKQQEEQLKKYTSDLREEDLKKLAEEQQPAPVGQPARGADEGGPDASVPAPVCPDAGAAPAGGPPASSNPESVDPNTAGACTTD
jgi:hypothetical protein